MEIVIVSPVYCHSFCNTDGKEIPQLLFRCLGRTLCVSQVFVGDISFYQGVLGGDLICYPGIREDTSVGIQVFGGTHQLFTEEDICFYT